MKYLSLLFLLSACATQHAPSALHVGQACPAGPSAGCLPPYPSTEWSMALFENGTDRKVSANAGVFQTLQECHAAGVRLGNPDIHAACTPL